MVLLTAEVAQAVDGTAKTLDRFGIVTTVLAFLMIATVALAAYILKRYNDMSKEAREDRKQAREVITDLSAEFTSKIEAKDEKHDTYVQQVTEKLVQLNEKSIAATNEQTKVLNRVYDFMDKWEARQNKQ